MIANYLKFALRNLKNNRIFSVINITGLAVGLASGILILLWVADEFSFNRFHEKLPNLFLVLQDQHFEDGVTYTFEPTPGLLASSLKTEIPEVKNVCRTGWPGKQLVSACETAIYERCWYVEPSFFEMFTYPALAGDAVAAMTDVNSVAITERTARKLFGSAEGALGKTLRHNNVRDLKVAAVLRDVPSNSSFRFDVALPFAIYEKDNREMLSKWSSNCVPTYVELYKDVNVPALNAKLENFIQTKESGAAAHIHAYPFSKWRLEGEFKNGKAEGGRISIVRLFLAIGIFILLIACINFMNLSTARSERRAREVGVRKVMGAQRGGLIGQFLGEAMLMSFFSLVLALILVAISLPTFNRITEKTISLDFGNWQLWTALLAGGLLTGLLAGSYPAFFLSRFQAIRVLKGVQTNNGGGSVLRKGLVVLQFSFSILLIIGTLVIYRQVEYAKNRPLGFSKENLISIPVRGDMGKTYTAFKQELMQMGCVESVSCGNDDLISFGSNTSGMEWPGKTKEQEFLVSIAPIGLDYVQTAGLKIKEGRDFSADFGSDTMGLLLNEAAVRRMGLKNPVGTVITWDTARTVVGVVEDFVYNNPFAKPEPLVFFLNRQYVSNFFVRFKNDPQWRAKLDQIGQVFKKHNPAYPFDFKFVDDEFNRNFQSIELLGKLANIFGGLAIFISCLGLFGLSAFVAERRKKEIGIRKVLGASVANIWFFLSQDFLKPVAIAFLLAIPVAWWSMSHYLQRFEYRVDLSWWIFALAGAVAVAIALLTVSFQGVKAALTDPVKSLKSE